MNKEITKNKKAKKSLNITVKKIKKDDLARVVGGGKTRVVAMDSPG